MKTIITGAGLVGINAAKAFGSFGYDVILISRSGMPSGLDRYFLNAGNIQGETVDICNIELLRKICSKEKIDCIVHLSSGLFKDLFRVGAWSVTH